MKGESTIDCWLETYHSAALSGSLEAGRDKNSVSYQMMISFERHN